MTFTRTDNRACDELRPVRITPGFVANAEGSALIEMGNTRVICAASVEDKLPPHLRNQRIEGWITAEYAMLPRSTHTRTAREIGRGGPSGRTHEIQRLIGRSLRAISNRKMLGEREPFTREQMDELLELARRGIEQLVRAQREAIASAS